MLLKMLLFLLAWTGVFSNAAVISPRCNFVCGPEDGSCLYACNYNITHAPPSFFGAPWVRLVQRFNLGELEETVTGCDSPLRGDKENIYFTTLQGKVYRYKNTTNSFDTVFNLGRSVDLAIGEGKGLYDVAFHREYEKNFLFYLHYAIPAAPNDLLTLVDKATSRSRQKVYQIKIHHYNVISEFRKIGDSAMFLRQLRKIPQVSEKRSGGWLASGIREGWKYYTENPLYFATGGNTNESIVYGRHMSYLSSLRRFDSNNITEADQQWASGIGDPISCASTVHKSGKVVCLIQVLNGTRMIYTIEKDMNIGSDNYVEQCTSAACANGKKHRPADRVPMAVFPTSDCNITSIFIYTGYKMNKFRGNVFLSRDACYNEKLDVFQSAQLLRLVKNRTSYGWYASVLPSDFEDGFLVNTSLVGADKHSDFFFSGYSLRTGKLEFYSIDPVRAANDYYED